MQLQFQEEEEEIKLKNSQIQLQLREIAQKEHQFHLREKEHDSLHFQFETRFESLQDKIDRVYAENEKLQREGERLKNQGQSDQLESEQISYFKHNKAQMLQDLQDTEKELLEEKEDLRNERTQLEVFKNTLKTKQIAIERARFTYLQSTQGKDNRIADPVLSREKQKGPLHANLNPVRSIRENIPPNHTLANQRP